jgi:hypothetical protein
METLTITLPLEDGLKAGLIEWLRTKGAPSCRRPEQEAAFLCMEYLTRAYGSAMSKAAAQASKNGTKPVHADIGPA